MATFSEDYRNAACDLFGDRLNNGHLLVYTGSSPGPDNAATGTLLFDITLPADAMAAASSGSCVMAGSWSTTAAADGTAGYFRFTESDTTVVNDGTVGLSGADLNMSTLTIASGGTITATAFTHSQPAS